MGGGEWAGMTHERHGMSRLRMGSLPARRALSDVSYSERMCFSARVSAFSARMRFC